MSESEMKAELERLRAENAQLKNKNTGEILDADIAFNAVDYTWADRVESPDQLASNTADFQNALTHELGHVIGLDHSCYAPADGQTRLLDNTGSPDLDCYSNPALPTSIAESTMYPSVSLRDTTRRDLSTDDQQGVCEIYPYAHETCPISEDYAPEDHKFGGCTTLPGGPRDDHTSTSTGTIALATVAAALLSLLNRRSRKRI